MSLRCKACNNYLDTKDPDYCSRCLNAIKYYEYNNDAIESLIETDEDIINEILYATRRSV